MKAVARPQTTSKQVRAGVSEIFSSIQGEGPHIGEKHLFVRFETCNIHCCYCDELGKKGETLSVSNVLSRLKELEVELGPHAFVSLTGGEPLIYLPFLEQLMPHLKKDGFRTYLETNGILSKALERVLVWTDVIAMDVKPASVTNERSFLMEHEQFLKSALHSLQGQPEVFIKMIVSKEIDLDEFNQLCQMIRRHDEQLTLVLQPISGDVEGHHDRELMKLLIELQRTASGCLKNVRLIPRLHRILHIQ